MARTTDLTLAEGACLAAVQQGLRHGWAIGSLLAADGEIGRIWTLSRPLTYRAIDSLIERRLLTRRGTEAGRGRDRTLLQITAAGSRAVVAWLATPVDHLRDVRTELLRQAGVPGTGRNGREAAARGSTRPVRRRDRRSHHLLRRGIWSSSGGARAPAPYAASSTTPSSRNASRPGPVSLRRCASARATSSARR